MRVRLKTNQHQLDWPELLSRVRLAEDLGFDGVFIFDHFRPQDGDRDGPCPEAWSLLAALAATTERIRLGALATGVTWRHPSVLAAQAATVDAISGGRLDVALGAAWDRSQHEALGVPFPPLRERVERLEEAVRVLRLLWGETPATFQGRHLSLREASYRPRPVRPGGPPVWIAAGGDRLTIPVAARCADVWHCPSEPEELPGKVAVLEREAEVAGRDPASIVRATTIEIDAPWTAVRAGASFLRELGFTELVVPWPAKGRGRLEEFAGTVLPELHGKPAA